MAIEYINFKGIAAEVISVVLEKKSYTLVLQWNTLSEVWVLDIYTAQYTPIVQGLVLYPPHNITRIYNTDRRLPQLGDIWCVSANTLEDRPNRDSVPSTLKLVYIPHADAEQLGMPEYY